MQRLFTIFALSIVTLLLISCDSTSVAPETDKSDQALERTAFTSSVTDPDVRATLGEVHKATAKYHDVDTATNDGYVQVSPFVPGMGYHYLNPPMLDAQIDPKQPEALVYMDNPVDDSKRRLGAVEYIIPFAIIDTTSRDALDGKFPGVDGDKWHKEHEISAWTLHAWIWYDNPEGVFHPTNPRVSLGT